MDGEDHTQLEASTSTSTPMVLPPAHETASQTLDTVDLSHSQHNEAYERVENGANHLGETMEGDDPLGVIVGDQEPPEDRTSLKPHAKGLKDTALTVLAREPGKSILPFSRVQKIIKADKDIPIVAKEATFIISLAAEGFIQRLSSESQRVAHREKRTTVQQRDVATVARKADEFAFLEEIIPFITAEKLAKRKPKALQEKESDDEREVAKTFLDRYVSKGTNEAVEEDVVMNEDGTMSVPSDKILPEIHQEEDIP